VPPDVWWESDRRYFSLVADTVPVDGGLLFVSERFADLPPGFVASVPGAATVKDAGGWVDRFEDIASQSGARLLRSYLPPTRTRLAECLEAGGYSARPEVGLRLPPVVVVVPTPGDEVSPIGTDADWAEELTLQRNVERAWCDVDADRWVSLERAQSAAGCTRYLVRHRGVPVSSFGRVRGDPLLRPKSLVVHPCHRGRGHSATAFAPPTTDRDDRPVGAIAVEDGYGHRSYARLGLRIAHRFVEWSRPV
jgi:hypothetical protein